MFSNNRENRVTAMATHVNGDPVLAWRQARQDVFLLTTNLGIDFPLGDANLDGLIDVADLVRIQCHMGGAPLGPNLPFHFADINRDDAVDEMDAEALLHLLLGTEP